MANPKWDNYKPKQHIKSCGTDSCGDGTACSCPCHDDRLLDYTLKEEEQW